MNVDNILDARSQKKFWLIFLLWSVVAFALASYLFGFEFSPYCLYASGLLAFEFKVLELCVAVFLGIRKANKSAIFLLVLAKIAAWGLLLGSPFILPQTAGPSFALGALVLVLSVISFLFQKMGMPRISAQIEN